VADVGGERAQSDRRRELLPAPAGGSRGRHVIAAETVGECAGGIQRQDVAVGIARHVRRGESVIGPVQQRRIEFHRCVAERASRVLQVMHHDAAQVAGKGGGLHVGAHLDHREAEVGHVDRGAVGAGIEPGQHVPDIDVDAVDELLFLPAQGYHLGGRRRLLP
jgi:hypothetical protein